MQSNPNPNDPNYMPPSQENPQGVPPYQPAQPVYPNQPGVPPYQGQPGVPPYQAQPGVPYGTPPNRYGGVCVALLSDQAASAHNDFKATGAYSVVTTSPT